MNKNFELGDIVKMKKQHPCGINAWKVIRIGADVKIKCTGCGRIVMLTRSKFEKDMKGIIESNSVNE
ncbi:hypothetical protein CPAST_c40840 [Clostridium pasteurianum DSM 525 = ATCC 6013]|uniref:DUF951 domain-containing protein n=1 Tax=Clostridium pasteurianum DSM 525 = ATCC 6013 TaxID=1262449 RepID=A0A0H3JB29_CLOPA|nr:DUF951 domain-containing protein [Clostridium pasteurianum]AJA50113.1 hypothetical protein CPAST_c40840 [Clostridium pasteurianum DSM 525 = ATCC 6013]AJA54101.1 hypothetical protein CLPA_c40840 [Clostridium pasteurianum DSM 525 = ATCC 6013]AOZ77227.1 hypothetical protein AQ983_19830 [Clostridium pasteurianum DSM 525 = ATCC 6013]AOZ81023.1 hypothetical protein AQ984_19825 [Clostridium pasteurianum]ELP59188.1 hypothetical protein F502_09908 [Clostridium pasteurianum DSM 525 = ATCC 6013]